VTDRGLYDYLTKELGIKFVNGSGVVDLPFEKVRQLNLRRIGKT
jgi:hypothetical protein